MYFVTDDESIVPCRYDQGRSLFVVDRRDYHPGQELVSIVCDGDEEFISWNEVVEETRRVFYIDLGYEEDEEGFSDDDYDSNDEDDYSTEYSSESSDDEVSEDESTDVMEISRSYGFQ